MKTYQGCVVGQCSWGFGVANELNTTFLVVPLTGIEGCFGGLSVEMWLFQMGEMMFAHTLILSCLGLGQEMQAIATIYRLSYGHFAQR